MLALRERLNATICYSFPVSEVPRIYIPYDLMSHGSPFSPISLIVSYIGNFTEGKGLFYVIFFKFRAQLEYNDLFHCYIYYY